MPVYYSDAKGVTRYLDTEKSSASTVLFDRSVGTNVAGWSEIIKKHSHYKTINESDGQVTALFR